MKRYKFSKDTGQVIDDRKPMTRSVTIWGGVIATLPPIWNIIVENIPHISESLDVIIAAGVLSPQSAATISMIGGLLAIFGRVKAEKEIKVIND